MRQDEPRVDAKELAAELSRVRARGIADVDRNTAKQARLDLPLLDALGARTSWWHKGRAAALRRMLTAALDYVSDTRFKEALAALYGLEDLGYLNAAERKAEGLRLLEVSPRASSETQKAAIRDARLALADALLAAGARLYVTSDDRKDPVRAGLEEMSRGLFDEFRTLRTGRGVTPARVEREAPTLLGLPGVASQQIKSPKSSPGEAAIEFLSCAVRMPAMHPSHFGLLASMALNLTQAPRSYAQRRDDWVQRRGGSDSAAAGAYPVYEEIAFGHLAELVDSLKQSPCDSTYDYEKSSRVADSIFELLLDAAGSDLPDTLERLKQLITHHLPQFVDRIDVLISMRVPEAQQVGALVLLPREELRAWQQQYWERIDDQAPFYTGDLAPLLLRMDDQGLPFTLSTEAAMDRFVLQFAESNGFDARSWDRGGGKWAAMRDGAEASLSWTLRLFSQILAYNELASYWWMLLDQPEEVDREHMPEFPLMRIGVLQTISR